MFLLLLAFTSNPDVQLTLTPNATEIQQRDNLLLLSVLENKSISAVHVMGRSLTPHYVRYEIQEKDGSWISISASDDQLGLYCGIGGKFILGGNSTLAEYAAIHRRTIKGDFLFEAKGTRKIRALVTMPWGDVASEPIAITVQKRSDSELKQIESIRPSDLWALKSPSLHQPMPESLLKLKSVGGNIARTIEYWEMARIACKGGKWKGVDVPREKSCTWMQKNMDSVSYEHSLDALAWHHLDQEQWPEVVRMLNAMKYDSSRRESMLHELEVRAHRRK